MVFLFSRCRLLSVRVARLWFAVRVQSSSSSNLWDGRAALARRSARPPGTAWKSQPAIGLAARERSLCGEAARCRRVALCKTPLSQHWTGAEHPPKAV